SGQPLQHVEECESNLVVYGNDNNLRIQAEFGTRLVLPTPGKDDWIVFAVVGGPGSDCHSDVGTELIVVSIKLVDPKPPERDRCLAVEHLLWSMERVAHRVPDQGYGMAPRLLDVYEHNDRQPHRQMAVNQRDKRNVGLYLDHLWFEPDMAD